MQYTNLSNIKYKVELILRICNPDHLIINFDPVGAACSHTQQTQNICITFKQCRPNVSAIGQTLYKSYANVLRLLGTSTTQRLATVTVAIASFD